MRKLLAWGLVGTMIATCSWAAAIPRDIAGAQQAYILHQPFSMSLGFSTTNTAVLLPLSIDPVSGGLMVTLTTTASGQGVTQTSTPWIVSFTRSAPGTDQQHPFFVQLPSGSLGTVAASPFFFTQTGSGTQFGTATWPFTVNQGTNPWVVSGTVTANQGTSPWTSTQTGGYLWTRFDPSVALPSGSNAIGTVTANAGTGTFTIGPVTAAAQVPISGSLTGEQQQSVTMTDTKTGVLVFDAHGMRSWTFTCSTTGATGATVFVDVSDQIAVPGTYEAGSNCQWTQGVVILAGPNFTTSAANGSVGAPAARLNGPVRWIRIRQETATNNTVTVNINGTSQ